MLPLLLFGGPALFDFSAPDPVRHRGRHLLVDLCRGGACCSICPRRQAPSKAPPKPTRLEPRSMRVALPPLSQRPKLAMRGDHAMLRRGASGVCHENAIFLALSFALLAGPAWRPRPRLRPRRLTPRRCWTRRLPIYKEHGRKDALDAFNKTTPPFSDRTLYVFCIGPDRTLVADGEFRDFIGQSADLIKDASGKKLGQALLGCGQKDGHGRGALSVPRSRHAADEAESLLCREGRARTSAASARTKRNRLAVSARFVSCRERGILRLEQERRAERANSTMSTRDELKAQKTRDL